MRVPPLTPEQQADFARRFAEAVASGMYPATARMVRAHLSAEEATMQTEHPPEPSDAERAAWPPATADYVAALEAATMIEQPTNPALLHAAARYREEVAQPWTVPGGDHHTNLNVYPGDVVIKRIAREEGKVSYQACAYFRAGPVHGTIVNTHHVDALRTLNAKLYEGRTSHKASKPVTLIGLAGWLVGIALAALLVAMVLPS